MRYFEAGGLCRYLGERTRKVAVWSVAITIATNTAFRGDIRDVSSRRVSGSISRMCCPMLNSHLVMRCFARRNARNRNQSHRVFELLRHVRHSQSRSDHGGPSAEPDQPVWIHEARHRAGRRTSRTLSALSTGWTGRRCDAMRSTWDELGGLIENG